MFTIALLLLPAFSAASNVAPALAEESVQFEELSVADMESSFSRSQEAHQRSMTRISASLTTPDAMDVLAKMTNAQNLEGIASFINGGAELNGKTATSLRQKKQPGYSGIDGARKLLNDMIFESLSKYDQEIAKCTEFYSKQCALMEIARGEISAANFIAANSRALILDAQYNINKCEVSIPELKQELKEHNLKCKNELKKLNTRLKIVMGDIAVMTMILKMTDCETKLVQMNKKFMMLRCENECTKKHYVRFNHKELQQKVTELKS